METKKTKYTALYERLSRDDEMQGESNHRQPQTNTAAQPYQQVQWMQAWPETFQRPRQNRNQRKKLF